MDLTLDQAKELLRKKWDLFNETVDKLKPSMRLFIRKHFQNPEDLERLLDEVWGNSELKKIFDEIFDKIYEELKKEEEQNGKGNN